MAATAGGGPEATMVPRGGGCGGAFRSLAGRLGGAALAIIVPPVGAASLELATIVPPLVFTFGSAMIRSSSVAGPP